MPIADNLHRVHDQIRQAAVGAGRNPAEIKLVAVSKTFPPELVVEAFRAGARDIGENRVEEARDKIPAVNRELGATAPSWHLIGHLQRRKAREAVELFALIQSVDTLRLAETLDRHAGGMANPLPVLLQVNVAQDPDKFGFAPEPREALFGQVERIVALPHVAVRGLMTIGPLVPSPDGSRPFFRALRELRDDLAARFPQADWSELSMGMTDDFKIAIEEGATIVRIGRAIFGQRN